MLRGSLPVGRMFGTTIRLHWSAAAIAVVLGVGLSGNVSVVVSVLGVVGFFVAIVLHELAHALVARRFGIITTDIDLWGLGGLARLDRDPATARADGWIAAAGPLANLLAGAVAAGAAWIAHRADISHEIVLTIVWFAAVNVALALFNLLPGAPLDGGRVLRAVRWARHGNRYRAMREAAIAGNVLGIALGALGLGLLLSGRSWFWLLASGVFISVSARFEAVTAMIGERIGDVKVNAYTWFGVAEVGPDMDVDSMIWQRSRMGGAGAVAVRGERGTLDGLVLEEQLWAVPDGSRPATMLTSLMAPLDRLPRADVDDDLAGVLASVHPRRPIVTVWRDGRLLGVIPPPVLRACLASLARPAIGPT